MEWVMWHWIQVIYGGATYIYIPGPSMVLILSRSHSFGRKPKRPAFLKLSLDLMVKQFKGSRDAEQPGGQEGNVMAPDGCQLDSGCHRP